MRSTLAAFLLAFAGTAAAQPYGLEARGDIGAYLGGALPDLDPGNNAGVPATLSALGAFGNLATLAPAAGLVPYGLIVPFWSDGASKSRWIAMPYASAAPSNPAVSFAPVGEWVFPDGTVFVKHFELVVNESTGARRRLETRVLVRDAVGGVYGRTYRWRPDGTRPTCWTAA
jgi:hypothetical protein